METASHFACKIHKKDTNEKQVFLINAYDFPKNIGCDIIKLKYILCSVE